MGTSGNGFVFATGFARAIVKMAQDGGGAPPPAAPPPADPGPGPGPMPPMGGPPPHHPPMHRRPYGGGHPLIVILRRQMASCLRKGVVDPKTQKCVAVTKQNKGEESCCLERA